MVSLLIKDQVYIMSATRTHMDGESEAAWVRSVSYAGPDIVDLRGVYNKAMRLR